jgi:hypothetical protein
VPLRSNQPGNRRPYRARVGLDFDEWLGVRKEGDPSSNKPNQPRHLVNARLVSGEIVCRGGQEDVLGSDTTLNGCVTGIFAPEFQFTDLAKTLFHGGANTGIAAGRGTIWKWGLGDTSLFYYDTSLTPAIDDIAVYDSNTIFATVRAGGSTKLYEIKLEASTDNVDSNGSHAVLSATLRGTITQGTVSSSSCCVLGTDVYVAHGASSAITDQRIYKWNGTTFTSVDSPSIGGAGLAVPLMIRPTHTGGLIVLKTGQVTAGTNTVRVMSSSGTWSYPTGDPTYLAFDVAVFNGATYISALTSTDTHTATILVYDGSSVSVLSTLTEGAVSPETEERDVKVCMTVAQGKLWFARGYNDGFNGVHALLGSWDGTNFNQSVLAFDATGQTTNFVECHGLALIEDSLVILADGAGSGVLNVISSPGSDFDGVWVEHVSDTLDTADSATTPSRLATLVGV